MSAASLPRHRLRPRCRALAGAPASSSSPASAWPTSPRQARAEARFRITQQQDAQKRRAFRPAIPVACRQLGLRHDFCVPLRRRDDAVRRVGHSDGGAFLQYLAGGRGNSLARLHDRQRSRLDLPGPCRRSRLRGPRYRTDPDLRAADDAHRHAAAAVRARVWPLLRHHCVHGTWPCRWRNRAAGIEMHQATLHGRPHRRRRVREYDGGGNFRRRRTTGDRLRHARRQPRCGNRCRTRPPRSATPRSATPVTGC